MRNVVKKLAGIPARAHEEIRERAEAGAKERTAKLRSVIEQLVDRAGSLEQFDESMERDIVAPARKELKEAKRAVRFSTAMTATHILAAVSELLAQNERMVLNASLWVLASLVWGFLARADMKIVALRGYMLHGLIPAIKVKAKLLNREKILLHRSLEQGTQ